METKKKKKRKLEYSCWTIFTVVHFVKKITVLKMLIPWCGLFILYLELINDSSMIHLPELDGEKKYEGKDLKNRLFNAVVC